jgi:hypothetical protein
MKQLDELTLAAQLFEDSPEPSAQVIAAARARMTEPEPSARTARQGLRRAPRRFPLGLGLVTGIAAAAVLVVTIRGGGDSTLRLSAQEAKEQHLAARQVLLAAADTLDKEKPLKVGSYWRQRTVEGKAFHVDGDGNGYLVYAEVENDSWEAKSKTVTPQSTEQDDVLRTKSHKEHEFFSRPNPVGPQTPEDTAAWKKAGSPTQWKVTSDDDHFVLTMDNKNPPPAQGATYVRRPDPDAPGIDDQPDVDQRLQLGKEPAVFVAAARNDAGFIEGSAQELMTGSRYVGDKLASPQSRAALFRMLANLPGVRSIGSVKDAHGRPGIGLAPPWIERIDGSVVEYQLILDPRTYDVLGDQMIVKKAGKDGVRPGALFCYAYTLSEGWTNQSPPRG